MAENSKISWCHHTFNCWWGCQKISEGCKNCYAEGVANRFGDTPLWGPGSQRRIATEDYWLKPYKWNAQASKAGERRRVFCASMSDVFEDHPQVVEARERLWLTIEATPFLDWLLLSKRPENIKRLAPWGSELKPWPRNIWLGVSAENQARAEQRIPLLLDIPAWVRFVSYEPALGSIWWSDEWAALSWVIVGGESGGNHRAFDMAWARGTKNWCARNNVAFFFKQDAGNGSGERPWLVEAWCEGSWRRVLAIFGPVTLAFLGSLALFGLWPLQARDTLHLWWNASLWPWSLPVGVLLLGWGIRRHSITLALAASPFLSPYVLLHAWAGAVLALAAHPRLLTFVVVGLWLWTVWRALS